MGQQTIFLGTNPNDGTGESLFAGGGKINNNFTEIYALQSQTINAGAVDYNFTGATLEQRIQLAIDDAILRGFVRVKVPAFMLPYDASLVTFSTSVQMTREGGDDSAFDVRAYGAAGDGVQDDTIAFRATIAGVAVAGAIGYVGGKAVLPKGVYKITDDVIVSTSYVQIWGDVQHGTTIYFAPSASEPCIEFNGGGSTLWNCGIRNIRFASNDTTIYQKTMVKLVDVRQFHLESIISADGEWTGNGSIGLWYLGRDLLSVRDCWFAADQPLKISPNPNFAANAMDFATFAHSQFAVSAGVSNYNVEIADGVTWTNNVWRDCDFARGLGAVHWIDTTSPGPSYMNGFDGCRQEQSIAGATYSWDLESTAQNLQSTFFIRCYPDGLHIGGIKLRRAFYTSVDTIIQNGNDALNLDATCKGLKVKNLVLTGGATTTGLSGVTGCVEIGEAQTAGISGNRGDADVTLVNLVDNPTQRFTSALTVDRTVTLSATNAHRGAKFRVARTGLGAGQLLIPGIKNIPAATAAFVDMEHDGSGWKYTGYGLL